jgi:hypothetical protein
MVIRPLLAAAALLALMLPAATEEIQLAAWVRTLPAAFTVEGSKVEPTYVAAIEIRRDGDGISILGGAPAWMERSRETIAVDADGGMRHLQCPKGMDCSGAPRPAGFLSTAALIAAERRGGLGARLPTETYGSYVVVCVPAEMLGIERPILDPCFERGTGAAIAQKNRFSRRFDGPSLDPVTLRILPIDQKDKAP